MTEHYDEMGVPPDPPLAEELRQRLHARMRSVPLGDDEGRSRFYLDPARLEVEGHLVPMKELYMPVDAPAREGRSRWRIPTAVAVLVAVTGVAGIVLASNNSSTVDEVPPSAAAGTRAPITAARSTETGFFAGEGDDVPVTFTVPEGWESFDGWSVLKSSSDPTVGVNFFDVGNLYADPCEWVEVEPPVGPTVDDLVAAWANLPVFAATAAVDVTVDGYAGKRIEFSVPEYDDAECTDGRFGMWKEEGQRGGPSFWAQGPKQQNEQWILDVDGRRLAITAIYFPDTSPEDRAAIEEILASVSIG